MSSDYNVIDSETIETSAGDYTVTWHYDECADQPYNEGLGFAFDGGREQIDQKIGEHADEVLAIIRDNIAGWEPRGNAIYKISSAGIARYLRLKYGLRGIRLVSSDYYTYLPSIERENIAGIAWAPDDVPDKHNDDTDYPSTYTDMAIAEYRAWAQGDAFGWTVENLAGDHIDSCWGYYGFDENREYTLSEARNAAEYDAAQRVEKSNLVGAGFVGII